MLRKRESYTPRSLLPSLLDKSCTDANVAALLKHYFNIAFLMAKPQDLPSGERQMQLGLALSLCTYVLALITFTSFGQALLHAVIDLGCTGVLLYAALVLNDKRPRFEQAFGGLCGASAILNMAAIPLLLTTLPVIEGQTSTFAQFCQILLLVWSLSLGAHILRHTFEIRMVASIFIAFLYYLFITSVLSAVIPVETAVDQMSSYQGFMTEWLRKA